MSPAEFRDALAAVGLEKQTGEGSAARFFGVNGRTLRRWAKDGAPDAVALVLAIMIARRIKPVTVRRIFDETGWAPSREPESVS